MSRMHLFLKAAMFWLVFISTGREFHSSVDVVANVFPPSVALLLLGHRSVMCPQRDDLTDLSLTRINLFDRYSGHCPCKHV